MELRVLSTTEELVPCSRVGVKKRPLSGVLKITHVFRKGLTFLKRHNVENIRFVKTCFEKTCFEKTCFEKTCILLEKMYDQ